MKNFSLWTALLAATVLTSCGTSASLTSSSSIMDGIYYTPDLSAIQSAQAANDRQIEELTRETRAAKAGLTSGDTIKLGESREVTLPLDLDKSYVVLLEGETYEERLNKFNGEEPSFTINFEYNMGYGPWYSSSWYYPWYGPGYHYYTHHHWYNPYHCHYPYGWYDPWYDPWYYPYYGPSYAWGWYDPWYGPGFYPGYYPGFYPGPPHGPGYGPGPGPAYPGREVVYGRRETSRPAPTQAVASKSPANPGSMRGQGNEVNRIRGREVNRGVPAQGTRNPGEVTSQSGTTRESTTQRSGVNNYRKSNTPHRSSAAQSASTNRGSATATYQQNNSGANSTRYQQQRSYQHNSGTYNSGNSGYRSSGTTSSGGGVQRTGGRR